MFFAKSTGGFYAPEIHGDAIPADAVEVTTDEYGALLAGQSAGLRIVADASGHPVLAAPPAPDLEEMKTVKNAEIDAARAAANTFAHGGKTFACDAAARADIDGVTGYVALFGALPPDFPGAWKAVDDSDLRIADIAAWKAFYAALVAHGAATRVRLQEIKVRIEAANTSASVADIVW